jgi:hypothetical protein
MTRGTRPAGIAVAGILAIFWVQYLVVRPTNFGGWDEWLVIDLTWRGIVGLPYQNRPFSLVFTQPGALLLPGSLRGYWLVNGLYLCLTGALLYRLVHRLAPGRPGLAFLAGVFCVSWAPLDETRLDTVLVAGYSGFTCATLFALVLFMESAHHRSRLGLGLASAIAFLMIRGLEATAGLILAAVVLPWLVPRVDRWTRVAWSAVWGIATLGAAVLVAAPLLPGRPGSYQVAGLGFDPHPLRVASRLVRQFGFQLGPLAWPSPAELLVPLVPAAAAVFLVAWFLVHRTAIEDHESSPAAGFRMVGIGLGLAAAAHGVLVLSPAIVTPARMQILSAPGIGLLLAALAVGLADRIPRRWSALALALLGGSLVAMGAGRTAALQHVWDAKTYWAAQDGSLFGLTREAPQVEPHTLLVLLDEAGAWPAAFTFQHAVDYLYGGRARGTVWGGVPFLYPIQMDPDGIRSVPYESIQGPWRAPAALYRWDDVVVVRLAASGAVTVLAEWPDVLPPLPPSARYAPYARIRRGDPPPREQRLLVGPARDAALR